jgi:serine/threonine protein kinase
MGGASPRRRRLIFVSYSHQDEGWVDALGLDEDPGSTEPAKFWIDRKGLHPGDRWTSNAQNALRRASAAVLLVSRSFLDSTAIRQYELPTILRRWKKGSIAVVFVPIGDINVEEVGNRLALRQVHNVISIPPWSEALRRVTERRHDIRAQIVSAVTEPEDVQNLRRTLHPNYRLKRFLGSGSMGRVFIAHDRQLDRLVCVKLLHNRGRGADFKESVIQASKAADHTFSLKLYEAFLDTDPAHSITQYVPGDTLRTLLDKPTPFSPELVQCFLRTIGSAVTYAHSKRVVDLNIKPTNVIYSEDAPTNTPFMLSLNRYSEEAFLHNDTWRTTHDDVLYLPLEYRRRRREPRSKEKADQYRLGLVAYEMLVGTQRFRELAAPLRQKVIPDDWQWPLLKIDCADCPGHLRHAIDSMVSSNPDDRYDSIDDAVNDVAVDLHAEIARDSFRRLMDARNDQNEFFRSFYRRFLDNYPGARQFFVKLGSLDDEPVPEKWVRQFQLLKEAVLLLVVFSVLNEGRHEPNILTHIVESHAKRGIHAGLYEPFGKTLVDVIVAKDQPPHSLTKSQLERAWTAVVRAGMEYMQRKTSELQVSALRG